MPDAGVDDWFLRGNDGDSNLTGRNFLSALGDGGADFGVHTGAGGDEFDFFSKDSCDRYCSDQMPSLKCVESH